MYVYYNIHFHYLHIKVLCYIQLHFVQIALINTLTITFSSLACILFSVYLSFILINTIITKIISIR